MTTWQNNPGGGYYSGPQGYPPPPTGYPGQPGYPGYPPTGEPGYPGYPAGPPGPGFIPPTSTPYGHIPPQPGNMYGTNYGGEAGMDDEVKGFQFNDLSIRQAFIRKVYSILLLQLLVTLSFICLFTYHSGAKQFARNNIALMYVCLIVTFVLLIAMACCTNVRRQAPMNFVFLGIFTLAESVLLGFFSTVHKEEYVLTAVGVTAAICFGLTIFAFQTKFDFTGAGTYLFVAALVLMVGGLFCAIFPSKIGMICYSSLGAILFSFYLVYDTQLMIGGKHKYSLSPEEYIFAALNLYLDIINIFIYVLNIISASSRD